jgi:hypothetical protein
MLFTPYNELLESASQLDVVPDDASASSTFEVDRITPKPNRSKHVKKAVTFDESHNIRYAAQHCKEDCHEHWYSPYDVQGFRTMNTFALKKMYLGGAPTTSASRLSTRAVIEHTYNMCQSTLLSGEDASKVLTPSETEQLKMALQDPAFPSGLTLYTTLSIRREVRIRRSKVVDMVKLIQRTIKDADEYVKAEYIRGAVEAISRPARIFARLVGQAHHAS